MPKVVDHDERRAALAEAVWRLASREGLEALTLRDVSAEAGCSTGALHHYFRDKEELLLFAFQTIADRVGRRIDAAKGATSGPLDFARTLLAVGLPLDAERRAEIRVWFAFLGLALTRPVLAGAQRDAYRAGQITPDEIRASLKAWIAHAKHADTYRLRQALMRQVVFKASS
jgi:AcrR family transcriptional regulator